MRRLHIVTAVTLALGIVAAGCGASQGDRALSGAGLGAATGAVGGALAGGDPAAGAILGGAVGAAVGALTAPDEVYLGRAPWRR